MKKKLFFLMLNIVFFSKNFCDCDVTVIGTVNMADGVGRQSVELVNVLKNDFSVNLIPTGFFRKDVPLEVLRIIDKNSKELGNVIIFEDPIRRNYDNLSFFKDNPFKLRIAYYMIESTGIPEYCVSILNSVFDCIVIPDEFLIEVCKISGITIPIFVIPLGLDLSSFFNVPLKETVGDPLVFANFSAYESRKNHKALIESFYEAFGNDPSVELWLNGRSSVNNFYSKDIFEETKKQVESLGVSNIFLTKYRFNSRDYLDYFKKIDCYINLSKGEGFSIQPREAMALGIPVILSNNTTQTTICRSNLVKAINCSIATHAYYDQFECFSGLQYEFDKEEAIKALRQMKANYKDELNKSPLMRSWVARYDYSQLHLLYKSLVKPKKVFLGDENIITEDYLMTTSEELYRKYEKLIQ